MAKLEDPKTNFRLKQQLLCSVSSTFELAELLETNSNYIEKTAQKPHYDEFDMPKKSGGTRHIEDPEDNLKEILRTLNDYLQIVYYQNRSASAYGFMIVPAFDKKPRTIRQNALQHLNRRWMLNADFKDFFHQIKYQEIYEIFCCPPFNFNDEVATILAKLTTYKGRLPMGSPTSPVLSNFATRLLDKDLEKLAQKHQWTYTRFADDLTFSADEPITMEHFEQVKYICDLYGYVFNENKIKFMMPHEPKIVTGLVVTNKVDIPADYIESLSKEIEKLRIVLEINYRNGKQATKWLRNYQQQIEGAIEFIRQIETSKSPDYQAIKKQY
ncbi:MAG: reverse transcriptase family protein, partial [Spirosomaceae bacterium]|nr:reverse transcriptase family protein [Spirosomataceae bacterium]